MSKIELFTTHRNKQNVIKTDKLILFCLAAQNSPYFILMKKVFFGFGLCFICNFWEYLNCICYSSNFGNIVTWMNHQFQCGVGGARGVNINGSVSLLLMESCSKTELDKLKCTTLATTTTPTPAPLVMIFLSVLSLSCIVSVHYWW